MSNSLWAIDEEESDELFLDLKDPEGWGRAWIKWDGCIEYDRFFNAPRGRHRGEDDDVSPIHICDVDEEIERLQALKEVAITHFRKHGREWPG